MESRRYRRLCRIIDQLSPHRQSRLQFSDAAIVKVYFHATHHKQPVSWACKSESWSMPMLHATVGLELPSQSTMSRRMRSVGVLQLIERVLKKLAEMLCLLQGACVIKPIDSKPLRVGSFSKDRDAKRGYVGPGEKARGYKLHAITCGDAFIHFTLLPMNRNDQFGAAMLLPQLREDRLGYGYVPGDNAYDANPVYRAAADVNHQLIAPPRKANAHVRDTKRNCPQRIRSLDLCANPLAHCGLGDNFGRQLLHARKQIERNFGHAAMDGLDAPPPWVRTPRRLAPWAAAKLIQRMMRQLEIKGVRV